GAHDAGLVDVDGIDGVVGGKAVGPDVAVLPLHHLVPHGEGALRGGVPELDVPDDAAHQAQVHGGNHVAVGGFNLLLDADVELNAAALGQLPGKEGVQ